MMCGRTECDCPASLPEGVAGGPAGAGLSGTPPEKHIRRLIAEARSPGVVEGAKKLLAGVQFENMILERGRKK